jgi:hypothetical protein
MLASCRPAGTRPGANARLRAEPQPDTDASAGVADIASQPFAVFKPGPDPFWFCLGEGGPRLVPSPAHAEAAAWTPWKLARRITGLQPLGSGEIAAAVNGDGFIVFSETEAGNVEFFFYPDAAWRGYSASRPWKRPFDGGGTAPAVLLARDEIFQAVEMPPPLDPLPALGGNGAAAYAGPELTDLVWDGAAWFMRQVDRAAKAEIYAKQTGGALLESNAAEFLAASAPKPLSAAPAALRAVLEKAAQSAGGPCTFAAVSPDFETALVYGTGLGGETAKIFDAQAWFGGGENPAALALLPDGRGFYRADGAAADFALPGLPENFVYSGAAVLRGAVLVAAWEEQKEWNTGAAGFMAVAMDF